jgi:hypothetical protein
MGQTQPTHLRLTRSIVSYLDYRKGLLRLRERREFTRKYPDFFWKMVEPHIGDALRYLRVTQASVGDLLMATYER